MGPIRIEGSKRDDDFFEEKILNRRLSRSGKGKQRFCSAQAGNLRHLRFLLLKLKDPLRARYRHDEQAVVARYLF
jgi:hypothetical protein